MAADPTKPFNSCLIICCIMRDPTTTELGKSKIIKPNFVCCTGRNVLYGNSSVNQNERINWVHYLSWGYNCEPAWPFFFILKILTFFKQFSLWVKRIIVTNLRDADYADDLALLANTPNQAETLLHSLERAAAGIGLHVNAHKTEYMYYNQTGNIATLDGASLKIVDKFTYLGSSVSSTEKDIDTRLTNAWTAIDRLSIIWKSDLTDKMKRSFFQAAVVSILLYGCTTWALTKRLEKKLDGNYTRMLRAVLNKSWRQHPMRHQLYGHLPPSRKLYKLDEPDTWDTAGEARTSS